MWVSKRYFLSIILVFSFVWAGSTPYFQNVNQVASDRHCILVTYDNYPKALLNAKSGQYFIFPDGYNASFSFWMSQLSPNGKYIAYVQPALEDPFGINFDLYIEEIATGSRFLVVEDVAQTATTAKPTPYTLEWSADSERLIFFNRSDSPQITEFGFVANINGEIEHRWDGWFYEIQWSPDNSFLAFAEYDTKQKQAYVYIWDRKQNKTTHFRLPSDEYVYAVTWAATSDRIAIISGTGWTSNDRIAEFDFWILTRGSGVQLRVALNYIIEELEQSRDSVKVEWIDHNKTVEIFFRESGVTKHIERIDARTGKRLPEPIVDNSDKNYRPVDGSHVYLPALPFTTSFAPPRPAIDFNLKYTPQRLHDRHFYYEDTIHPYWRLRKTLSMALVWEYDHQLYVTLYDLESKDIITHQWPFTTWKNLQIDHIFNSELITYEFEDRIGSHSGVFDARTGQFIVEFFSETSEIPRHYYQEIPFSSKLEQLRIFAFANDQSITYFDRQGEALLHQSPASLFVGSPDEQAILGVEYDPIYSSLSSYVWLFNAPTQQTKRYEVSGPGSERYGVRWSPGSEFVLVNPYDHILIFSHEGELLWKFPPFRLTTRHGSSAFDWVRCDIYERWGDIEVIDRGRAERG